MADYSQLREFILILLEQGVLTPPVTFNGEVLGGTTNPGPGPGPVNPPSTYLPSGWKFNAGSPINSPRSKGCDELRNQLNASGFSDVAAMIPEYHCIKWWAAPSIAKSYALPDKLRFNEPEAYPPEPYPYPTGVTLDHVKLALDNIHALWNQQFVHVMGGFKTTELYRGEEVGSYPSRVQAVGKLLASGKTVSRAEMLASFPPDLLGVVQRYERTYEFDVNGAALDRWKKKSIPGTVLDAHKSYDVWWDGRTDAAVTRHWRSFARACGANVG